MRRRSVTLDDVRDGRLFGCEQPALVGTVSNGGGPTPGPTTRKSGAGCYGARSVMSVLLVLLLVATLLPSAARQVDTANLQAFLRTQLHLSDTELSTLNEGRPVVKNLPATMKREMTTVGGVRIRGGALARFVNQFKTLEGFRTSPFVLQIGKFSEPPQLGDLDALTLDAGDIDALRTCRVGACDVQLAAGDIRRFNTEVNWEPSTAARDATALYKTILFAHLTEYRAGGRDRLVQYHDQEAPLRLTTETIALLDATAVAARSHARLPGLSPALPDRRGCQHGGFLLLVQGSLRIQTHHQPESRQSLHGWGQGRRDDRDHADLRQPLYGGIGCDQRADSGFEE